MPVSLSPALSRKRAREAKSRCASFTLNNDTHWRETAIHCAKIGHLPLIQTRSNKLHSPIINITAHIRLEHRWLRPLSTHRTLAGQSHALRNIAPVHNLGKHPVRQVSATVSSSTAEAARRLEKPLFALLPPL